MKNQSYSRPTNIGSVVRRIGEGYHSNLLRDKRIHLMIVNADHWKSWVHQRLTTPMKENGAMTVYQTPPQRKYGKLSDLARAKHEARGGYDRQRWD